MSGGYRRAAGEVSGATCTIIICYISLPAEWSHGSSELETRGVWTEGHSQKTL